MSNSEPWSDDYGSNINIFPDLLQFPSRYSHSGPIVSLAFVQFIMEAMPFLCNYSCFYLFIYLFIHDSISRYISLCLSTYLDDSPVFTFLLLSRRPCILSSIRTLISLGIIVVCILCIAIYLCINASSHVSTAGFPLPLIFLHISTSSPPVPPFLHRQLPITLTVMEVRDLKKAPSTALIAIRTPLPGGSLPSAPLIVMEMLDLNIMTLRRVRLLLCLLVEAFPLTLIWETW